MNPQLFELPKTPETLLLEINLLSLSPGRESIIVGGLNTPVLLN